MEKQIGRVIHFYPHITVAVLQLEEGLQVGDVVHVQGHTTDFTQTVESLEINHEQVLSVGPGADATLRVDRRVRESGVIYKVVEAQRVGHTLW